MATDRTVQALAALLAVRSPGLAFADALAVAFDALVSVPVVRTATVRAADGLRLRESPGARTKVLETLPDGTTVEVWGASADGAWMFVTAGESGGWVSGKYLEAVQVAYVLPAE